MLPCGAPCTCLISIGAKTGIDIEKAATFVASAVKAKRDLSEKAESMTRGACYFLCQREKRKK